MQSQPEIIVFHSALRDALVEFRGKAKFTERELEPLLQERFSEGWEAGQKSLSAQLVQQRAELLQMRDGVISSLREAVQGVIAETEEALVELTFASVCKIVGSTSVTREMVRDIVAESLEGVTQDCVFELRLHPEDLEIFKKFQDGLELSTDVALRGDDAMERGDCLVRTRFGVIDARRSTKLKNLEKELSC